MIKIQKSQRTRRGFSVDLVYHLTQDSRDEKLLKRLINYFKCGNVYQKGTTCEFRVTKFEDIVNIIIPFFLKILYNRGKISRL